MKAWWFEPADGKLGYDDGRKPRKGATHKVKGDPELCARGLHASVRLIDALQYAQSSVVWRVEIGGEIVRGDDKCAGTERTYIQRLDIEPILFEFARWSALQVIHLWEAPDVVVQFLKTGDESLRDAAWDAAWDAARDAASAAAWAAARDAARAAASAAAWAAARAAAWDAASAAASAAARAAASAAAWDAAWDAARATQNRKLTALVRKAMRAA